MSAARSRPLSIALLPLLLVLSAAAPPLPAPAPVEATWPQVERLIDEQKLAEAARTLTAIEADARARGDEMGIARALVRETQVGIALGGYESAVEALAARPWPTDPLARAAVELYQAQALLAYLDAYGWEIASRERVVSGDRLDLKLWTREQITAAADRAFAEIWERRDALGAIPVQTFEFLRPNDYPAGIRPTLRDAVTYLWADRLSDSSHWSPAQLQELWKLDLDALTAGSPLDPAAAGLADGPLHPLARMAAITGDLEQWHRGRGEIGAALEARLERLRILHDDFTLEEDRERIRQALAGSLPEFRQDAWWAMGMARLAGMQRQSREPDGLARARSTALEGERAFPGSPGAAACRRERQEIEAPSFDLQAMTLDGPGRRSIEIRHRNLGALHFRAYRLAPEPYGSQPVRWRGWNDDRIRPLLAGRPLASWRVALPPTADFRDHRTFTTPPFSEAGRYLVVASADPAFRRARNRLEAVEMRISRLVLLHEPWGTDTATSVEARALDGESGAPLAGAEATLYRWQWERLPEPVARQATDADGRILFDRPELGQPGGGFTLVVQAGGTGGDEAVWQQGIGGWRQEGEAGAAARTLLFTDRSIYRPGQELLWKTLTFEGDGRDGGLHVSPGRTLTVELLDPNGEKVATATATSNGFGTASGSFRIPPGRLLGAWRIETDAGGSAAVAVEEYKRPTFEVTLDAPTTEARLNRPVEISGEGRYYFGLPVTAGRVAWRVVREPLWFRGWRGGWFWAPPAPPRTIASGTARPDAEGRFSIRFTAEADEREKGSCGCYRFRVEADLTDEGGETRSGSRELALGWVGVRLEVADDPFLVEAGGAARWLVRRSDLDGQPRAGATRWRIVELVQPSAAPLPAELPADLDPAGIRTATPGDRLQPRWAEAPASEQIVAGWPAGDEVAAGVLEHGADGAATLALPGLAPGVYRLQAETRDRQGELALLEHSFVVAEAIATDRPTPLAVPLDLRFASASAAPGETARLFVHSGRPGQTILLEIRRRGEVVERRRLRAGEDRDWIELAVGDQDRGGISARAVVLSDYQLVQRQATLAVPWDDKRLTIDFATFRDRLEPGQVETYRLTVRAPDGSPLGAGAAELVASMYDRSLDFFRPHPVPRGDAIYPLFRPSPLLLADLGAGGAVWSGGRDWWRFAEAPSYVGDSLVAIDPYGIGGPGAGGPRRMMRGAAAMMEKAPAPQAAAASVPAAQDPWALLQQTPGVLVDRVNVSGQPGRADEVASAADAPRSNFAETAFWQPHLVTDATGSVSIEFRVPESLTSWRVWASAWTKEMASGYAEREVRTAKELMVRPYLPRFLREGDTARLEVVVSNGSDRALSGELVLALVDPDSGDDLTGRFGLAADARRTRFDVPPGSSASSHFTVTAPPGLRPAAVRVEARAGGLSDGELRPLPMLPARLRLAQSRFAAVPGGETRTLRFDDMTRADATRNNEQLVITIDGQLFYGILDALPYLVDYPYECTEQTMNRYLATALLASMFERHPAVARMAKELARRDTRWERFDGADPNRRMALEETPWLRQAQGGEGEDVALLRVLDPAVAGAVRADALARLAQAQLPSGAFPWFPGGPPSPYMTLYLMSGFARAAELGDAIPEESVRRGWQYLSGVLDHDWWRQAIEHDCCWELLTFANYVASSYADPSLLGDVLPAARRREILDFGFAHWKQHAPQSKLQLALTLQRMGRPHDARLVLDSVMDASRSDPDLGTYWEPEDRAWLWYNDTLETHAWALRALSEIAPDDPRRAGLVQWLFLQKKLGHWKSTRATAEVLDALARFVESTGTLGEPEQIAVTVGGSTHEFLFAPDRFTGRKNQVVLRGDEIVPDRDAVTTVASRSRGLAFASATWLFATDRMPEESRGDLFHVDRSWYRRVRQGEETTLVPLAEGERLQVGDELEVQLAVRARSAAEYVHLRDPRPAGLEPDRADSGWRWDLGLAYYEETRDSGTNFFFEALPAGEYTLRYRLRATIAGTFRAAPAELQSMYAPEFTAYSAGAAMEIDPAAP